MFKKLISLLWILLVAISFWQFINSNITFSQFPKFIVAKIEFFVICAPFIFVLLYVIRPILFFPATILSLSAGIIFGPVKAIVILIIAENISAFVSYSMGKYFGKNFIDKLNKNSFFIRMFEKNIHNNDFVFILVTRLLFMPFDLVGYFAGASDINYSAFASATLIGIIPGLITVAFLGGSLTNPYNLFISVMFFIIGILLSRYVKKYYYNKNI